MSNLEVLELTAKSIRSWNFRPFLAKFTGEYLYGPVLSKNIEKLFSKVIFLIFKVEICRLWQKTLIFDNFFLSDYGRDRYRFDEIYLTSRHFTFYHSITRSTWSISEGWKTELTSESHTVVLNAGTPLGWESSALTIRSLLQKMTVFKK